MKNNGFRVNWFLVVTLFTLVLGGCIGGAASQPASGQASGTGRAFGDFAVDRAFN